jgi:hypothetical protein
MSLANLSLPLFLSGLAALAALLAILQLLRVRYQRVDVVTTMFWKEAIEESRARVLLKRFRRPLAYVLVLAIAALLWGALAEPESPASDQRDYLVLLDGSAVMQAGDRYAIAVRALTDQISQLPKAQRRVVWCGSDHRVLLDRGEVSLLLSERLKERRPEASPASVDAFLGEHLTQTMRETSVFVLGDAGVSAATLASLPESVTVERVQAGKASIKRLNNAGITAIGVGEALSGRYDAADVYVRVDLTGDVTTPDLVLEPNQATATELNPGEWVFRDLPADGSTITVRLLASDDLVVDNEAKLTLQNRERIRVRVDESMAKLLNPLLRIDPAVVVVDKNPDIVFGEGDSMKPSFQLVAREAQEEAFVLRDQWPDAQAREAVEAAFRQLGIDQIDATSLAADLATSIQLGAETGVQRQVHVWSDLFSADYNLVQSSAFPLFIARSVRWLVGQPELVSYLAVGEVSDALDIAGVSFAPTQLGATYQSADGEDIMATLGSLGNRAELAELDSILGMPSPSGHRSSTTWLILLALLLLLLEWGFFQKGWMP